MDDSEAITAGTASLNASPDNPSTCVDRLEQQVIAITRSIFSEPFQIETAIDPENPQDSWRVIDIRARGDFASLFAKKEAWHDAVLDQLGDDAWRYTLCIAPVTDDRS